MAMFLSDYVWVQVIFFMTSSLASLVHLGYTHPYEDRKQNKISMVNECFTLLISYFVLVLIGWAVVDAEMSHVTGIIISRCLQSIWLFNGVFIIIMTITQIKRTF